MGATTLHAPSAVSPRGIHREDFTSIPGQIHNTTALCTGGLLHGAGELCALTGRSLGGGLSLTPECPHGAGSVTPESPSKAPRCRGLCPPRPPGARPHLVAEDLLEGGPGAAQGAEEGEPEPERAVVSRLQQHHLRHDQRGVPHVAAELRRHRPPATRAGSAAAAAQQRPLARGRTRCHPRAPPSAPTPLNPDPAEPRSC